MEFSRPLCPRHRDHPQTPLRNIETGLLKHLILLNSKTFLFFFFPSSLSFLAFCLFISDVECKNRERALALQRRPHLTCACVQSKGTIGLCTSLTRHGTFSLHFPHVLIIINCINLHACVREKKKIRNSRIAGDLYFGILRFHCCW